jgi:uncharacterized membrane protein YphA (DoxX/SURF4 family)
LDSIQLARFTIGLSWIYHGFFPKLLHIAPLERLMTGTIGFTPAYSDLLTRAAGVGEILFGIVFIVFYRIKAIVWCNVLALAGLLIFVSLMAPVVLIEAFNPVTTNLPLIVLSVILLKDR